jgi:ankyrin repeat protein
MLLDRGAKIDAMCKRSNMTVLQEALKNEDEANGKSLISFLTENGADVNFCTTHGHRALDLTAFDGRVAYIEHLIDLGADVNPTNAEYLPLTEAARNGHMEVIRVLLERGADINAETRRCTAIQAAFWG